MKIALTLAILAAAAAVAPMTSASAQDSHLVVVQKGSVKNWKKNPRKFEEVVQRVQYDGEYSPPDGRMPEPEASPTVPVRYIPEYERQIPVYVKPAPRYVDEKPPQGDGSNAATNPPAQNGNVPPNTSVITTGPTTITNGPADLSSIPGPLPSQGSATGSTATANYGSLPTTTTIPGSTTTVTTLPQ